MVSNPAQLGPNHRDGLAGLVAIEVPSLPIFLRSGGTAAYPAITSVPSDSTGEMSPITLLSGSSR